MPGTVERSETPVLSYLTLRKFIGVTGTGLPFVLALGNMAFAGFDLEPSISDYYYTAMGDVFVGSLCAIGFFLLAYRAYREEIMLGVIGGCMAIGVALFPTTPDKAPEIDIVGIIHYLCALVFFLILAIFCLRCFTKTKPDGIMTTRKQYRNAVYRTCGWIILISMFLMGTYAIFLQDTAVGALDPVFWLESIAVLAFGIAWLTKGEAILKDI